jgi:hypothetical protein
MVMVLGHIISNKSRSHENNYYRKIVHVEVAHVTRPGHLRVCGRKKFPEGVLLQLYHIKAELHKLIL